MRSAGAVGWTAACVLLLLAAGGAAAAPGAVLLGAPSLPAAGLVTAVVGGLAGAYGLAAGRPLLGLAPLVVAILAAAPVPGLRALTGPPLFAVAAAGIVLVAASQRRPPAALFLPLVLALYAGVSLRLQRHVGPNGDEPHYLMVADSLLRDGDLSLETDYALGRYRAFHDRPLQPHYRVRGKDGAIYSLHAVGLSLLILPAYAAGGYPAVSFFMAALAALLAREVRELARQWTGRDGVAEGVGWAVALSPPLVHYAGLVFTEVPAALLLAFALRQAAARDRGTLFAWGAAVAFLPWLNVRYAVLSVILLLYALAQDARLRGLAARAAPLAVSAALLAGYHQALYGFFDPRLVYGRRPEFAAATLGEGLPGMLLDQEFGLLVYAPLLALALPGLAALARERGREAAAAAALVLAVLLVAGSWHMWRGGFNPPARFLVPVLPVLAAATGFALRRGVGAGAALVMGWSLWAGLAGAWQPRLVHRDRDGTAPFFRAYSGAEEWTRLLPAYVLAEPDRHRLAAVWAAALAAVAVASSRVPRGHPALLAAGCAGLAVASAVASLVSDGRSGGRDALRVVGRPALVVPPWAAVARSTARWRPEDLPWGPAYEPHRHPGGAVLAERVRLPPGRYRLWLGVDDLSPPSAPGRLEIQPEGVGPSRQANLRRVAGGFEVDFEAGTGEPVTLLLRDGGPFLLKELRLAVQPSAGPAV